ncbi:hypothetical protein BWQ96_04281 [Gracilariopsis chorda]|uniref:Uncharacterized protein n=1 Tax=Gracilariopsis chorda TaxID=448386 RepID=A0A2V3IUZ8_9FLOR|nr:hypothetical protein BWQ96_04281 [Gracilariopsis chorda]|eukprot:PXF45968.1 hypothetical protein BWQ96_04281 [Gracilariopsis chorda]
MSVDLFFPENRSRAQRLTELVDDITAMQRELKNDSDNLDAKDENMRPLLNKIMENNGFTTFDELVEKSLEVLTADEAQDLRDMLEEMKQTNTQLEQTFGVFALLTLGATSAAATAKAVQLLKSGALVTASRLVIRGIARAISGSANALEEAAELFKASRRVSSILLRNFETSTKVGRVTKFVKTAGTVMSVVGFFADAIVVVLAAVEGARQKEELQRAIKENFTKRIEVALINVLGTAAASFNGNLESILILENQIVENPALESVLRPSIDVLTVSVADSMDERFDAISYESAAETFTQLDIPRNSFTSDDPSVAEAIKKLDAEESIKFD